MCCWARRAVAAVLAAGVLFGGPAMARAADFCTVGGLIAAYEDAEAHARAGRVDSALQRLDPLGVIRFPPALGLLAQIAPEAEDKAMWARLAADARDAAGRSVLDALLKRGEVAAVKAGRARAEAFPAKVPSCLADQPKAVETDAHGLRIGTLEVAIDDSLDAKVVEIVKSRFPVILNAAQWTRKEARGLLAGLRRVEIRGGDRYGRYVGWLPGEEGRVMNLSVGTLLDDGPSFTAEAMVLAAQRAVYDRLKNRRMADPRAAVFGGLRAVTSVYPDVDGKPFFQSLKQALAMAAELPESVRPALQIVDEVHYNPPSKHFIKFGPPDGAVAYYDRFIGREGRRVIFVRRDMRWSSHADLLLSIVHEGVHALQDAEAEKRAAADPDDPYARLWFLRDTSAPEYKQRIRFECEALIYEIKAADALGLEPSVIEASPYLGVCDDARKVLVSWKDRRFRNSLDAYTNQ
jgi:hypothetical protein